MRVLVAVLLGICLTAAEPAPPVELPADAQAALTRFVTAGAQLQRDGDVRKATVLAKLTQALEAIQATESKAGRLESALAVKALHDHLIADQAPDLAKAVVAPGLPKSVARPADAYQTDLQKVERDLAQRFGALKDQTVKELEVVKVAETKAGRLDAAVAVKDQQDQLKSGQAAGRKALAKVLVFGKGATIAPLDLELFRRGGSTATLEFVILSITKDGMLFEAGGQVNGQSVALMGNALWYAIANRSGAPLLLKVPLGAAKPPLHLAIGYDKGTVQIWINGVLAKQDTNAPQTIGDNGGGGFGLPEGGPNEPSMPRQGFEGELAAFRFVDKLVYTAPFTPSYPLPPTDSVRVSVDAASLDAGPLTEIKGAQRLMVTGEVVVKAP